MDAGTSVEGREAGPRLPTRARRLAGEVAILIVMAVVIDVLGPFGSDRLPTFARYAYWMVTIVGGGLIGVAVDETLGRRIAPMWRRVLAVSVLMTPPVTLLVLMVSGLMLGHRASLHGFVLLLWQVFVIALPLMSVRALVWRSPAPRIETRVVVEPPLPEAEAAFRRRLSARRRVARLIAVEAHDHYLRVHTDAGEELLSLRFADALEELSRAHGYQVHRSWWVAADAIEAARWRRGSGELRLAGERTAPISRTFAPNLKAAGWL